MAVRSDDITGAEARRIALAAQGFASARPERPTTRHLLATVERLSLHQIDSVNVLARAHYLPAFSRLGTYDRSALDELAWGKRSKRRLFEYWGHEASLLPLNLYPLMRWRMAQADRGQIGWTALRAFATERPERSRAGPWPHSGRRSAFRFRPRDPPIARRLVVVGNSQAGARMAVLGRACHHINAAPQL